MSEFALLKRIARNIRYEKLDTIVNSTVSVENWDVLDHKILHLITPFCSQTQVIKIQPLNFLAFAKYGLLDTTIEVLPELLAASSRKGVRFLSEMGWLDKMGFVADEEASCLADISKDIEQNKAYIQIYLHAQHFVEDDSNDSLDASEDIVRVLQKLKLLGGTGSVKKYPLPNEFKVTDAFITNAPSIGMWKNFYL